MIAAVGIGKVFGQLRALDDINLYIDRGECVALIGANGAGKSTLLRILSGLTRATQGSATVAGYSIEKQPNKVRSRIGFIGHHPLLYGDLSAEENLRFYAKMYGVPNAAQRIDELLEWVELKHRRFDLVRTFSRGMQQRLAMARAILHRPEVLLLDEPFTGLDAHAAETLTQFIKQFLEEKLTIVLTTHDIDYAMQNVQRILLLKKGRLLIDDAAEKIERSALLELLH